MTRRSKAVKEAATLLVLERRDSGIAHVYLVAETSFHAVRALWMPLVMPGVTWGVQDTTILNDYLPDGRAPRYSASERPLQSVLFDLRTALRSHGGSPEAVRILDSLGQLNEEDIVMAKAKLAKTAETETLAPVKGKGKGNPEALKKAREARAEAGPDTRKITITNKENPYREGSGRAAAFDALKGAKTVEAYEAAGGKRKYLGRWVEEGRITLA